MYTKEEKDLKLTALKRIFDSGHGWVVGRFCYRSMSIGKAFMECDRADIAFLENRLKTKDNHVVMVFQIMYDSYEDWPSGVYYVLLGDLWALFSRELVEKEF